MSEMDLLELFRLETEKLKLSFYADKNACSQQDEYDRQIEELLKRNGNSPSDLRQLLLEAKSLVEARAYQ